jgi:hypothetical protein
LIKVREGNIDPADVSPPEPPAPPEVDADPDPDPNE